MLVIHMDRRSNGIQLIVAIGEIVIIIDIPLGMLRSGRPNQLGSLCGPSPSVSSRWRLKHYAN